MTEKQFEELIQKACQVIAEEGIQKKEYPPVRFSKRHERRMKQMFQDMEKGIDIQAKYGKKIEKR